MKTVIVTTTINVPHFLKGYAENAKHFNHDAEFIVAGDMKTPLEAEHFCAQIEGCTYLSIAQQEEYMKKFPLLRDFLPYNSAERRNVAMLMAYERGAEVVITLDDDNYATSHDMIGAHQIVNAGSVELPVFGSTSGWFNVCSVLQERNNVEFYHRGFPFKKRWTEGFVTSQKSRVSPAVNAGLWLDNPDTDAITRLERELIVTGYKRGADRVFSLTPGTWSPFNCQNMALRRDLVPAYFLSPNIGRHADILASFVINKLVEYMGEAIVFGDPLALHKRSPHDLWKDLDAEREGIQMADVFCDHLRAINLTGTTYHECFGQIVGELKTFWAKSATQNNIIHGMSLWHHTFTQLGAI